jgi:hypothetical protein
MFEVAVIEDPAAAEASLEPDAPFCSRFSMVHRGAAKTRGH